MNGRHYDTIIADDLDNAVQELAEYTVHKAIFGEYYGVGIADMLANVKPFWNIASGGKKMKQLFWTAVLYRKGKKTTLVVAPEAILAASKTAAKAATIKEIPSNYKERFDRLEVVVCPF